MSKSDGIEVKDILECTKCKYWQFVDLNDEGAMKNLDHYFKMR